MENRPPPRQIPAYQDICFRELCRGMMYPNDGRDLCGCTVNSNIQVPPHIPTLLINLIISKGDHNERINTSSKRDNK